MMMTFNVATSIRINPSFRRFVHGQNKLFYREHTLLRFDRTPKEVF